jgi:1-phosphatidylinositol-3-phosphate 5-kinase
MARDSRDTLNDNLLQIHVSAKASDALTTFGDLTTPPPASSSRTEAKGIDLVQGGFSGLYNRIKASVGGVKDAGADSTEDGLVGGARNRAASKGGHVAKSPAGTAVSSPIIVSVPSSRLQSPLVSNFPDQALPPSRGSNISSSAVSSKPSLNGSKSSLATSRTRTSIGTNMEFAKIPADDGLHPQSPTSTNPMSASIGKEPTRYPAGRNEPYRPLASDMDLREEESDTTEDDLVMVDGGGFANDNAKFAFPSEPTHEALSRVTSRADSQYMSMSSTLKSPGRQSDTGSESTQVPHVTASAQTPVLAPSPQRPPLVSIGPSHLPGYRVSRNSSSDGLSSIITSTTVRTPTVPPIEEFQQQNFGLPSSRNMPSNALSQMRRKVLDREFWMRDENAKDCFNCGDTFSTFRRKHHCRTCGQIFDAKCTSLVAGKVFGQSGNLRVCKPCEAIIYGNDDDSSVYTDDGDQASLYEHDERVLEAGHFDASESDHTKIGTPTISIPMSRKSGSEKKRRSAVIEVAAPALARPSSSRSLRSLSGRPRSSSHKRHHSRHQHMRNVRYEDRAPFHQYDMEGSRNRSLPAFHHDNIIDPDLAPFMSDEDSSEEEQASIFATLAEDTPTHASLESERSGIGGLLSAMRKGKPRPGDRSVASGHARDADNVSITSRHISRHSRHRNVSVSSIPHRQSPKRSKSNSILRSFGAGLSGGGLSSQPTAPQPQPSLIPSSGSKITRSASMQGGNAPAMELNHASLQHVRKLLKQMLQDAGIAHVSSWEKALVPILLQCTDDVNPNVQRNDDIDIRHYIKLKKIPGGGARDTSYVSGVVFRKNIALKSMPRSIPNPRIIIVTFAIEYARHQTHFMSLEPVIAQEREYLRNLVSRIAALQPNLLLVQRNVSGLALEFLEQAGIAVAYNVKSTVLNAVARCTQSRMISSVDKLAIDPSHLGRCESFDVKTYVHTIGKQRSKQTYIYLSGCQRDLGCTIVLRGAENENLRRLKRITEFMCYVVYNLKLETCLMRDEFVLIPSAPSGGTLALTQQKDDSSQSAPTVGAETQACTDANNETVKESCDLSALQHTVENLRVPDDAPAPSYYSEMVENHYTKILSASPFVKFMQPYLLNQAREYERKLGYLKKLRDQYKSDEAEDAEDTRQKFELVQPEMVHTMVEQASKQVREFLHAVHAAEYDKALHNYQTQKRQWEAYLSGNMNLFDPFNHQKIAVLYSVVNSVTSTPCIGPEIIALGFYHEHDYDDGFTPDCTLGQYVEDLCYGAGVVCEVDGCNRRMIDHHRQYVHGPGQMSVIVQKFPSKIRGLQNTILMWSCCRLCGQETQVIPMSDNTWKYSFAKYLELTFWSSELHPRADVCPHDIHKDHVRYFGLNNVALRIQYDAVQLYEVTVPRPIITWKVDSDLKLKNEQFLRIEERLDRFMSSVRSRIRSIHVESVIPEKVETCRAEVDKLLKRVNEENEWLRRKLQEKYMSSRYYEIIPLNRAIRAIQEKAISWDDTFTDFEQQFFPSEKDIRRLATLQLKRLFLERDESSSSLTSVEEGAEPVVEEPSFNEKGEPMALKPMPSTMSPEQAHDMLTSVVEEDQFQGITPAGPNAEIQPEDTLAPTSTSASPRASQELPSKDSVDVRHLDLAISSSVPENTTLDDGELVKTPTLSPEAADYVESGSPTPTATRLDPIDKSVADAIENMPSSPPPLSIPSNTLESKIPRLVDTIRRETPVRPAAMARTQSQPGGIVKHLSSSSNPMAAPSSSTLGESTRLTLSESTKALERMSERLGLGSFKALKSTSKIPRSVPFKGQSQASKVSKLAEHFEQLSREFQKERMRERRSERNRQARAYPLASSKPIVEVYKDVHEAVQEHNPSDEDLQPNSPIRVSLDNSTLGDSTFTETTAGTTTASQSPVEERHRKDPISHVREGEAEGEGEHEGSHTDASHPPSDAENYGSDVDEPAPEDVPLPDSIGSSQLLSMTESQLENSLELPKHEKTTLMRMLTSFWSERSASGWIPLDYPFAQIEHVWEDSDIIVREDEPSSIIALALSSPDYLTKLTKFRADPTVSEKGVGGLEASEASIERNLLHEENTNIRYGFTNRGVKAQCKIFYAQSFDALRRKCGVADRFVESLSRCSKWDNKGGKSKSIFLKTLDDRFVLKSLSPIEVQAFFRFAPNYFAFTHQNLFKGLPSVIAKMFGLFQVQIKTPTGRDFDWFMLVMENLFYDREPNRRYDLKGSMRNRKIQVTGERDEVLLDENLVDIIYSETPIFVREHTKKLLKASVWNDTLFLSQNNVMDYSLMAGFDDTRHEIIVGIIGMPPFLPFPIFTRPRLDPPRTCTNAQ